MPATRPGTEPLVGRFITLERLSPVDLPELWHALGRREVFAGGWGGGPAGFRATQDEFVAFGERYFLWESSNIYGARVVGGVNDGTLVGTSTLGEFDLAREHAHIGWTAWDPRVWATQVNAEAKLLMLGAAFDNGFGRVKLQADILNERSKAAIAGIGATFEGVVRRDVLRADGSWRDTSVYSVLVDEWPRVRAGLEARLEGFDGPVRFRP